MRCLITGASGWIGFAFVHEWAQRHGAESMQLMIPPSPLHPLEARRVDALRKSGYHLIEHHLLEAPFPTEAIQDFDVLIHCAAFTHTEKKDPAVHVNDRGTLNLLHALGEKLRGKRIIYFGSCASLDYFNPLPNGADETCPCQPLTLYGQTKLQGEVHIQQQAKTLGYTWTVLRLPTVYGPGYRPGGLFDIIKSGLKGFHPVTRIRWTGSLSLLYLDDLIAQLIRLSENLLAENETLHLADPQPVRFTKLFGDARGVPLPPTLGRILRAVLLSTMRRIRCPHRVFISSWRLCHLLGNSMVFNCTKAEALLPMAYTELSEGLRRTYQTQQPGLK